MSSELILEICSSSILGSEICSSRCLEELSRGTRWKGRGGKDAAVPISVSFSAKSFEWDANQLKQRFFRRKVFSPCI